MIGITFALRTESSDFVARLSQVRREDHLILGKIDHHEVAIVHTGVGAKDCNERLELLIHKIRPSFVVSSGFAGAVMNELHSGDLIFAENFSDPQLLARAAAILRSPKSVKLFTVSTIVDSIDERNRVARESGAAAVEMETAAIANICQVHGVPLLSLRAISDSPTETFPAPMSILFDIESQQPNFRRLIGYLFRHPSAIRDLARFSKRIASARASLTEAIVALVRQL